MKIPFSYFLQYISFTMAAGLVPSIIAAVGCGVIFLLILIPMLPPVFIASWTIGSVLGWLSSKREDRLPIYTYIWSIIVFSIISFLVLFLWLYAHNLRYSLGYAFLSTIGFTICSIPAIYYINKNIIPEMFIPPIPKTESIRYEKLTIKFK